MQFQKKSLHKKLLMLQMPTFSPCNATPQNDVKQSSTSSLHTLLQCIKDLVQDCSISIANALEILQSCTKPSMYGFLKQINQACTDYTWNKLHIKKYIRSEKSFTLSWAELNGNPGKLGQYCNSWCPGTALPGDGQAYDGLCTELILGLRPSNERHRYKVTSSLIGWAQT